MLANQGWQVEHDETLSALQIRLTHFSLPPGLLYAEALGILEGLEPEALFDLNHVYRPADSDCDDAKWYGRELVGWRDSTPEYGGTGRIGMIHPAAYENVIAITAADKRMWPFLLANWPPIAFAAPGVDIWMPDGPTEGCYRNGTSFAAAFATALIGEISLRDAWWRKGATDNDQLKSLAQDLGARVKIPFSGGT
jgi:hypothetical protein